MSVDATAGRAVTIVLPVRYTEEVVLTSSGVGAERALDAPEATSVISRHDLDTRSYTVLSGAAFGMWWGSLVALVGAIAGEWMGFELVRRYGRGVSRGIVGTEEFERFSVFSWSATASSPSC